MAPDDASNLEDPIVTLSIDRFRGLRRAASLMAAAAVILAVTAPASAAPATPQGVIPKVQVGTPILSGYSLPVLVTNTGAPNSRLFIVEQVGRIDIARFDSGLGHWVKVGTFLDIHALVTDPTVPGADEQGLLGLAFAPDYSTSGKFYVDYTRHSDDATVVSEYKRKSFNKADPASARPLLTIPQPYANHNGGNLAFKGGDLYIGMGDGGSGGDPGDRAQNLNIRLGKMRRIDPHDPDGAGPKKYTIPADNPFVGTVGAKGEIWSLGLRNPWRWSFDSATGDLWIGDVGQCLHEEVDHDGNAKGDNFGWNLLEGTHLFDKNNQCTEQPVCTVTCHTLPVAEYSHDGGKCAIVGGYVYRGSAYPAWVGHYLYGDYCKGTMWEVPAAGGTPVDVSPSTSLSLTSYGTDAAGELYATDQGGSIYKLTLTGNP
jgi:glucose/arabinose dehydrogenase